MLKNSNPLTEIIKQADDMQNDLLKLIDSLNDFNEKIKDFKTDMRNHRGDFDDFTNQGE